jgi:uncharacterized OB-fold protein
MADEREIPAPPVNAETADWWAACNEGKLMIPKDNSNGEFFWYPRKNSPLTGSNDISWHEASGNGTIYSHSTLWRAKPAYCLAYVTLDEGVTVMSNIVDCDFKDVKIGQKVKVVFKKAADGNNVPCFTPA